MYLLDSDWIIQTLARRGAAFNELRRLAGSPIHISIISTGEVYERAFSHANPTAHLIEYRYFLSKYHVLDLDNPIMEQFAELRAMLRRRGDLLADLNLLIAATALHHDLALLTFNRRHFERIPDLKLYQPG